MIDGLVKITDRLIELAKYRKEKSRRIFDKLIEPTFTDLLLIHRNYLEMFETVRSLLPKLGDDQKKRNSKLKQAHDFLSQKRVEFEPTRIKLRAITDKLPRPDKKRNKKDAFIREVTAYLSWTFTGDEESTASSGLLGLIFEAVNRSPQSLSLRERGTEAEWYEGDPMHPNMLDSAFRNTLDGLRCQFALVSEAYADIYVSVRDE